MSTDDNFGEKEDTQKEEEERRRLDEWSKDYVEILDKIASETLSKKAHEIAVLRELGNITHPLLNFLPPAGQTFAAQTRVHRSSIVPFIIWFFEDEYRGVISSVVVSAYSTAIRTLRWLLELAVWVCEFHTDPTRWKAQDVEKAASRSRRTNKSSTTIEEEEETAWESPALRAFYERLYVSEQFRIFSFGKVLELLQRRQIFSEIKEGKFKIQELYRQLSQRVHFSLGTSFRRVERDLRKPFSPQLGGFDDGLFNNAFSLTLQTIDIVYFLLIWAQISYYGYPTLREYINSESSTPFIAGTTPLLKILVNRGVKLEESLPFLCAYLKGKGALKE